ncbi:MAG TPA: acetylornithine transaminase [Victivallales bacterium]|nr:acetylornithine transaminase [Victivallales bacterium]HPO91165.1 acetylornithine transaminase [Victivallales bacterium]HRR06936.1 acetylornithine transaminase [Victivallales bacterium]
MKEKKKADEIKTAYAEYLMQTYSPELIIVKGQGAYVWDVYGKRYLDFVSGISVCNLGHCHPYVTKAVTEQASRLVHISNLYMNEYQPFLAQKLINKGFKDGLCFFCNSGAEANEGAIKLARKFGYPSGRYKIITMLDSFHGRTLTTLSATGRKKYREGFSPDMPGFVHVPFNDIDTLRNAVDSETIAIMMEPIQGEGGVIPAEPDFLKKTRELCDEKNLLLIFDEVQCGMGRTGTFFAYQNYGVQPDILTLAKALANGFPIGAVIAKKNVASVLGPGSHASTFGGNPLACAAAISVLDVFEEDDILQNCSKISEYLFKKLEEIKSPKIVQIRGKGLMIGIVVNCEVKKLISEAAKKGLLILPAGESVIRLLPPLIIDKQDVNTAIEILSEILK